MFSCGQQSFAATVEDDFIIIANGDPNDIDKAFSMQDPRLVRSRRWAAPRHHRRGIRRFLPALEAVPSGSRSMATSRSLIPMD